MAGGKLSAPVCIPQLTCQQFQPGSSSTAAAVHLRGWFLLLICHLQPSNAQELFYLDKIITLLPHLGLSVDIHEELVIT